MKKYFSLMAIAAAVMLGFASCSDDEGSTNPNTPGGSTMAQEIAGDYASNIAVTINSSEPIVSENTVHITAVSAEVVNLALNNFVITDPTSGAEIAPGDIVLENVPLMRDSLGISFMASDTLMLAVVPGVDPLPVPVVANGNVNGNVLDAHFDIDFMNGAMAIAVEIDGQKN